MGFPKVKLLLSGEELFVDASGTIDTAEIRELIAIAIRKDAAAIILFCGGLRLNDIAVLPKACFEEGAELEVVVDPFVQSALEKKASLVKEADDISTAAAGIRDQLTQLAREAGYCDVRSIDARLEELDFNFSTTSHTVWQERMVIEEIKRLKWSRNIGKLVRDKREPLEAKIEEFARAIDALEKSYIETSTELAQYVQPSQTPTWPKSIPSQTDAEIQHKVDHGDEFVHVLADDWLFCTECCKYRQTLWMRNLMMRSGMGAQMHLDHVCKRCIRQRSQDYDWDPWDEPFYDLLPFYHPQNPLRRCAPGELMRKTKCSGWRDGHSRMAPMKQHKRKRGSPLLHKALHHRRGGRFKPGQHEYVAWDP